MNKQLLKQYESRALSDSDMFRLLNNKCNLVLYPDLHLYKNIDQVLGKYGCCILLFEAKKNYGHWCC